MSRLHIQAGAFGIWHATIYVDGRIRVVATGRDWADCYRRAVRKGY